MLTKYIPTVVLLAPFILYEQVVVSANHIAIAFERIMSSARFCLTSVYAASNAVGGSDAAGGAASESVNGVYDLRTAFGAAGSQQTMKCTAAASNTLTGCSGGDFKIGSTIYIQAAGNSSTVSAPAAPAPTCHAYNGASCSGTVVYSYKIAAVQGAPNGAMSAPSSAGTITQSAETYPPLPGMPIPAITTNFTLPSATNVTLYAIYKSVNGGPYNFYTLLPPGAFVDSGNHAAVIFTCVDLAVPCTVPSTATPNDVYAQITAINGSTVTIGALRAQPKFWFQAGMPAATYPSTTGISGAVIVQHDDTPALYAASVALSSNPSGGQLQLHIPAGNYNLHAADPYGRGAAMHLNKIRNLTIAGDGNVSKFYMSNDRGYAYSNFLDAVCGYPSQEPSGSCSDFGGMGGGGRGYSVVDPVLPGSLTVTLTNPGNISHFAVGGYLTLYDPGTGYPQRMYGELNKIVGLNASTGQVTLAYPANKYYSAKLIPPYSQTCPSCAATPVISPVIPGPTTANLVLKNFWFRGSAIFLNYNVVDWLTETNLTIVTSTKNEEGISRHIDINNENLTEDGYWSGESYFLAAAAGSADQTVSGSNYTTPHFANSGQPCSEESVNIAWRNNTFNISGFGEGAGPNLMGGGVGCYGFDFSNNTLNITKSRLQSVFGTDTTAIAKFTDNVIHIDGVGLTAGNSIVQPLDNRIVHDKNVVMSNTWKIDVNNGASRLSGENYTLPGFASYALPPHSGSVAIYPYVTGQTILNIPMSGNITSLNFGSVRNSNLVFALNFQQPASGGPYNLPASCASYVPAIDCPNGAPHALVGANSNTFLWFWDDGVTIHYLGPSSPLQYSLHSQTLTGQSGTVALYSTYGQWQVSVVQMSGNIAAINLGRVRKANYVFAISFQQPASGGPYTLPGTCGDNGWNTGAGLDCVHGSPPVADATAGSTTTIWFRDDGTKVHEICRTQIWPTGMMSDWRQRDSAR